MGTVVLDGDQRRALEVALDRIELSNQQLEENIERLTDSLEDIEKFRLHDYFEWLLKRSKSAQQENVASIKIIKEMLSS